MCRSITTLRGLEPPATPEEVAAAARQYARKVAGLSTAAQMANPQFERAVATIASATSELIASLPPRRQPPSTVPPTRQGHPA
jgi:hypothetical protein